MSQHEWAAGMHGGGQVPPVGVGSLHGRAPQPLGVQGGSTKQLPPGVEGAPSLHGWGRNWGWELHVRFDPIPSFL